MFSSKGIRKGRDQDTPQVRSLLLEEPQPLTDRQLLPSLQKDSSSMEDKEDGVFAPRTHSRLPPGHAP